MLSQYWALVFFYYDCNTYLGSSHQETVKSQGLLLMSTEVYTAALGHTMRLRGDRERERGRGKQVLWLLPLLASWVGT